MRGRWSVSLGGGALVVICAIAGCRSSSRASFDLSGVADLAVEPDLAAEHLDLSNAMPPLHLFVTSGPLAGDGLWAGNLGGATADGGDEMAADSLCAAAPNKPTAGSYRAVLVDGSRRVACTTAYCGGGVAEHVDWVLHAQTAYVGDAGQIVHTDAHGLFAFPLPGLVFANGTATYWTGLNADWTSSAANCQAWTSVNIDLGERGIADLDTSSSFIDYGGDYCDNPRALLCAEQ